jgi:hypothetical protein
LDDVGIPVEEGGTIEDVESPPEDGDNAAWWYKLDDEGGWGKPLAWIKDDGVVDLKYLFPAFVAAESCCI